jgi:hypothetical protein
LPAAPVVMVAPEPPLAKMLPPLEALPPLTPLPPDPGPKTEFPVFALHPNWDATATTKPTKTAEGFDRFMCGTARQIKAKYQLSLVSLAGAIGSRKVAVLQNRWHFQPPSRAQMEIAQTRREISALQASVESASDITI